MLVIQRKILVKAIVTPKLKADLFKQAQDGIKKLDEEINFIEQRTKKTITELTLKGSPQVHNVREQLEWERRKREEARATLIENLKRLDNLTEGSEIVQGEAEGPIEVEEGANWEDLFRREIILKDGVVVEIR